jgi:hypothetical protein
LVCLAGLRDQTSHLTCPSVLMQELVVRVNQLERSLPLDIATSEHVC